MVASAFVLSLVFLAIGFVIVLIGGGYLWWKTRELRKQMRERMQNVRMQEQFRPKPGSNVIEGEVVSSSERTRR